MVFHLLIYLVFCSIFVQFPLLLYLALPSSHTLRKTDVYFAGGRDKDVTDLESGG